MGKIKIFMGNLQIIFRDATSFSVRKYTKFLFPTKQNARKITEMWRKTTNAPEKNLSSPRRLAADDT